MKQLPFGVQTFRKITEGNYLYIDKTKDIYDLISNNGTHYFISRPRRFGKSLMVSTLKEIFSGNKELFKGLWIYDKIEWKEHPVIDIDFSSMNYTNYEKLQESISLRLDRISDNYNIKIDKKLDYKNKFRELIAELSEKGKVVILVDEYDKPLTEFIEQPEIATANRDILKYFYETIKSCDQYIRFAFLTGVSKFSKVSVFSGLNNLQDITIDKRYSTLFGYTEEELQNYFSDYIRVFAEELDISEIQLRKEIKNWYNGYSWDGKNFVYNPFSIIALFTKKVFSNYWFETGTPTFLINQVRKYNTNIEQLEHFEAVSEMFETFDINKMNVHSLLFQTGYLTIKEITRLSITSIKYVLSYPNQEVRESLVKHILGDFTKDINQSGLSAIYMSQAILKNNIEDFIRYARALFASIPYNLVIKEREAYYHTVFYLVLTLVGVHVECEVQTSQGRIDAVIKNGEHVYILEFKIGSAENALQQIESRKYHEKYLSDKKVTLLGIGFDIDARNIDKYLVKTLSA